MGWDDGYDTIRLGDQATEEMGRRAERADGWMLCRHVEQRRRSAMGRGIGSG